MRFTRRVAIAVGLTAVLLIAVAAYLALKPPISKALSRACYLRGLSYYGKDDDHHAIAEFGKALALRPGYAAAYVGRGIAYSDRHDYDHAIADYDKAIALKPDFAEAYNDRGLTYSDKGDHDRAIADYDEAVALNPGYAHAYNNRATAWYSKKDYAKAWADVKRCREHGETPNPALVQKLRKASGRNE
jgi:tetratricopeptide (TPR) repeat protein